MKAIHSIVLACALGSLLIEAQLAEPAAEAPAKPSAVAGPGPGRGPKGVNSPNPPGPAAATTSITSPTASTTFISTSPLSSTPSASSARSSIITNTIEVSSFMTFSSSTSPSSEPASTSPVVVGTGFSGMDSSMSAATSSASKHTSDSRRTLIIVLSSVLGSVGIFLIAAAAFLAYRFGQGRRAFGHRGATPINDDEIASWRGTVIEQKERPKAVDPAMLNRKADSIALAHSPGWTWTASPTSLRSAVSPCATTPDKPSFLAKAPNSRAGLTDETVPGADPFIPPIKRQNSRLSKAPPRHSRSKSRRSSMSAKSVWSYSGGIGPNTESKANDQLPMWFDPDDHVMGKEAGRTENSSPGTSIFDGAYAGGLSPRPRPQIPPWESDIGRAIA